MVVIQTEDFNLADEVALLRETSKTTGAIVTFTGLVRDMSDGEPINQMFLEHYPGMTEKSIAAIIDEAKDRWELIGVRVIHRVGRLLPEDQIVMVAVSSKHRENAFSACEFVMDYLKTRAPFWKKELTGDGDRWLETKSSDFNAADRWRE